MTKVSTHLLCLYSDKTAEFGMLKRKVLSVSLITTRVRPSHSINEPLPQAQVLREYLQEPLQQVF